MEAGIWVIAMCMVILVAIQVFDILFGEDDDKDGME